MTPRERIGMVDFSVLTFEAAVELVLSLPDNLSNSGHPGFGVHFANAYNVALAREDRAYAHLLNRADYVFSDGVPITWVGKTAYRHLADDWDRVYGPDVMSMALQRSTPSTHRHYLLGSTPAVLAALGQHISTQFPNALVVGRDSPPFHEPSQHDLEERDRRIIDSGATMVWVGLGTPKQDWEVARLAETLPVAALAVGAAFDFLAGTTTQAPGWMQRSGLEWAYRFAREPRRLAKRYVWGNSLFIVEGSRTVLRNR